MTDGLDRADSEIALTALLAAGVTAYPSPSLWLYPYVKMAALGLLVLTLVKRIGLLNDLSGGDNPIHFTTHLMDPATNVSFLYLCYVVSQEMTSLVVEPIISPPAPAVPFSIVVVLVVFGILLVSQLFIGDPLGEAERIFEASSEQHQGEVFGGFLRRFSMFVGSSRTPGDSNTRQAKLTEMQFYDLGVEDMTWEQQKQVVKGFVIMLLSLGGALIAYPVLVWATTSVFDVSLVMAVLLLFAVLVVSALFRIWYSNYGIVPAEQRNGYLSFLGEVVTYVTIVQMVG